MKTGFDICFADKSVDGKFYMDLFSKYLKFAPYAFRKKYKTEPWNEKKHVKSIRNTKPEESISIYDLNLNIFTAGLTGYKDTFSNLRIEQDTELFLPSNSEVEHIISGKEFISAYLYYAEYVEIQSTELINNIKHKNFPEELYNSIKGTPFRYDDFGGIAYNIKFNPGRQDLISYTWLMAAWKMWFKEPFFKLVPKEKILSFKEAYEIKELVNGVIYVHLFEKLEESFTTENMQLQQKWRDEMGYQELINKYS